MNRLKRSLRIALLLTVPVIVASPVVLYFVRYTAPVSWALEKAPDRVRRKLASLFLTQPSAAELANMTLVIPGKASRLILDVDFPPEFDVTIFANPPAVNYPVSLAAAPDGTLYVSSDGNGSLDSKPHRGRVLRVRDLNGDGMADEVKAFVPDVDSPRGLVWDHDRLYLLHPPELTEYVDRDGDGSVDEQRTLVKGIGFPLSQRAGDHASNGLTLGVDGWLYAAIGDFGFVEAEGTDGRRLQLQGGGIVRVRTDGTGLELWAHGTRNVLEVAVSPLLEVIGRDNSGDDGWNVRLHHFTGLTEHGWPFLFRNFGEECLPALADYGGGSGAGAVWLDGPTIPTHWKDSVLTADWGRDRVYRHGLTPRGATYEVTQEEFCTVPRVTDLDVDANGALYVSSWKGASFMWVGREVGFVVRAVPKGTTATAVPDYTSTSEPTLLTELASPSHRRRLAAQRAVVRRGVSAIGVGALQSLAESPTEPLPVRITALFALSQLKSDRAESTFSQLVREPLIAPWALRAWVDTTSPPSAARISAIRDGLRAPAPRWKLEAVVAAGRSGDQSLAPDLIALLGDADPVIAHTASRALVTLGAWRECLAALSQRPNDKQGVKALGHVLSAFPNQDVVDGLLSLVPSLHRSPARDTVIGTLARLTKVEAIWDGPSWGTRPDTRGPFFNPKSWSHTEKIVSAMKNELMQAPAQELPGICQALARNRLEEINVLEVLGQRAENEPEVLGALVTHLTAPDTMSPDATAFLKRALTTSHISSEQRARAMITLARVAEAAEWAIILGGMAPVETSLASTEQRTKLKQAVLESEMLATAINPALDLARRLSGDSSVIADAVLLRLGASRLGSAKSAAAAASAALDAGWAEPRRRLQILAAARWAYDSSRAADFVAAVESPNPEFAAAAKVTLATLGIDATKFRAEMTGPRVSDFSEERVLDSVGSVSGNVADGAQLFQRVGCVACHTVSNADPPKGPVLAGIAGIYRRRELAESILAPNRTLAQGFAASHFVMRSGKEIAGFIVRESPTAIVVRTIDALEHTFAPADIARRVPIKNSLMPEGLVASLTINQFASLLAYLESLPAGK
jgi:putative membrane-bound dehydrogenase-like protein